MLRPCTLPRDRRRARRARSAAASLAIALSAAGSTVDAAHAEGLPQAISTADPLAVSYRSPPPSLVLTPYARLEIPVSAEQWGTIPDVAVLPDSGVVVVDNHPADATGAYLVAAAGSSTARIPLDAAVTAIVATAGPVVYGATELDGVFSMAAVALDDPNRGRVVASTPIADPGVYAHLAPGIFGNAPAGVVDRGHIPGAVMIGHVDTTGTPVTVGGLRGILTISGDDLVSDESDPARAWQLTIERHPDSPAPFDGESPPSPGADGTSVYWTSIGPPAHAGELPEPLQPVIAVLQPDGTGAWFSIPEGWSVASSDVGGTVLARRRGDIVELARLDPSATGPAPMPIEPLAPQCDGYAANDRYPLRRCDSGPAVRVAQQMLRDIDRDLGADGYFGPHTDRVVRRYQSANGLSVDGLIGPDTWRSLTEGRVRGVDADGSGVVDPWEIDEAGPPPFPPGREGLEHGGTTWAVVLAGASDIDDPAIVAAGEAAAAAGYMTGPGNCDLGAAEALGLDPAGIVYTLSVYLETEADAHAAQAAFAARGVDGVVAQLQTYCLD